MIRFLVVKAHGLGHRQEESVEEVDKESRAIAVVSSILSGASRSWDDEQERLVKVVKVDLNRVTAVELVPALEDMRLVLKEK